MARDTALNRFKERLKGKVQRALTESAWDIEIARQRRACEEAAEFVERHMPLAKSYPTKFALLEAAVAVCDPGLNGLFCEFGVYQGRTVNHIASLTSSTVHGFDSFEGLPLDWRPEVDRSTFKLEALPEVRENVKLHKGWFADTIPPFLIEHDGPLAFLHVDCDLYGSTKTIFDLMGDRIVPGTVIQFDEFFNFPGWKEGEFKAFQEFCEAEAVQVSYIGFSRRAEQVALKVLSLGS